MKNSLETNYSVNVGLSDVDLFELKSLIISFLKAKTSEKIITPSQKGTDLVVTLKKTCKIGDPIVSELVDLLDLVKTATDPGDDVNCNCTTITLSLPIM